MSRSWGGGESTALLLRARLVAALGSGAAAALVSGCHSGESAARPEPPPPAPGPVYIAPTEGEPSPPVIATSEPSPAEPAPPPVATQPPLPEQAPVAKHPPPTPSQTCAHPTRKCFQPHAVVGQIPPQAGEYDVNGCLSGNRVSGACEGFYASRGPSFDGRQCCYVGCTGPIAPCGRPLLIAGVPRVARLVRGEAWCASRELLSVSARELPPALAAELASAWQGDALLEHASVAAFANFALELLGVGAPAEFVERALSAGLDEVRHAELCFGLARAFGGEAWGPSAFELADVQPRRLLADVVAAVVEEACCAETVGALAAARQLEHATEPAVRGALELIAEDEARHAELGWAFVAWALAREGEALSATIDSAFERGLARLVATAPGQTSSEARAFGRLDAEESRALLDEAISSVINPARATLVSGSRVRPHESSVSERV